MKRNLTRLAAGALALTLSISTLPFAFAAETTDTTNSTAPTNMTPPDGMGTPPDNNGQAPSDMPQGNGSDANNSYRDVAATDWYYDYVRFVTMRGIMTGSNGNFSPNAVITRAAYIQALYQAAGSPSVSTASTFHDVAADSEYADAIAWAQANGIATGDENGNFNPDASLTREMAMTFLYRALSALNLTAETVTDNPLADFTDQSKISNWASDAMAALVHMGIIEGSDGKLNPQNALTNAQVAAMLYRALGQNGAPNGAPNGNPPSGNEPEGNVPSGNAPEGNPPSGNFGGSSNVTNGTAATTITEDGTYSNTSYTSTGDDENALRVDGATVTLSGITVNKTAGATSNTENGDFYGMNAGLLALNGANVTIKNATVTTTAQNGNGVFSYGTGTTVTISDSKIRTSQDNSGGIQTTGGAATYATNLDVQTEGNSSAAIRSDRGGGTVVVDKGSYVTNGTGSPAIYCTADIMVSNADLTANNSETVVVEGKNSVTLTDCDVVGNMTGTYKDTTEQIHNIMLYQSMSGDADVGTSSFKMTGGSLTAKAGDMFYVTNTDSVITLQNVDMTLANDTLLTVAGNSSSRGWGKAGANGGDVQFNAIDQTLTGNVTCDSISSLDFALTKGSVFTGSINPEGQGGTVNVTVNSSSTWKLTGDCYVTSVTNNGTIDYNGYTIYLADGSTMTA